MLISNQLCYPASRKSITRRKIRQRWHVWENKKLTPNEEKTWKVVSSIQLYIPRNFLFANHKVYTVLMLHVCYELSILSFLVDLA